MKYNVTIFQLTKATATSEYLISETIHTRKNRRFNKYNIQLNFSMQQPTGWMKLFAFKRLHDYDK